jgi:hypothetical protein
LIETPVEPYDDLLPAIKTAQATDHMAVDVFGKLVNKLLAHGEDNTDKEWTVVAGALTYERSILVPTDETLRGQVISVFHDNPESGHFEALKTAELVSRDFYWPGMHVHVRQ